MGFNQRAVSMYQKIILPQSQHMQAEENVYFFFFTALAKNSNVTCTKKCSSNAWIQAVKSWSSRLVYCMQIWNCCGLPSIA